MSYIPKAGLNSVGNYQVSGIPYFTCSLAVPGSGSEPIEVIFPSITQLIHCHNNAAGGAVRIGFSANGVKTNNYWLLDSEASSGKNQNEHELRIKTDRIFILGHTSAVTGVNIGAELTGIVLDYNLCATYSGSAGVG